MNYELRKAKVFVQSEFAGILSETDDGYTFAYNEDYLAKENAVAVSLTMPLQEVSFFSSVLFPFFDGLIPEGWLLNIVTRNWKIDQKDRFGLLLAVCHDCIGDVRIEKI